MPTCGFTGRYSEPLAARFADLAGVGHGQRVLNVGCGPGALTAELVIRAGPESVSAVEPSASFADAAFDVTLAQLELREQCRRLLPTGPIEVTAVAWAVTGRA